MSQLAIKTHPFWQRIPLYLQIASALILAAGLGILLGAGQPSPNNVALSNDLVQPGRSKPAATKGVITGVNLE